MPKLCLAVILVLYPVYSLRITRKKLGTIVISTYKFCFPDQFQSSNPTIKFLYQSSPFSVARSKVSFCSLIHIHIHEVENVLDILSYLRLEHSRLGISFCCCYSSCCYCSCCGLLTCDSHCAYIQCVLISQRTSDSTTVRFVLHVS